MLKNEACQLTSKYPFAYVSLRTTVKEGSLELVAPLLFSETIECMICHKNHLKSSKDPYKEKDDREIDSVFNLMFPCQIIPLN